MVVIGADIIKGRCIVVPEVLQKQAPQQLYINHMGIEKKILRHDSIYWIGMNIDVKSHIKNCSTCLDFQQTQLKEKIIHHEIPEKLWEVIGADIFTLNNKRLTFILYIFTTNF